MFTTRQNNLNEWGVTDLVVQALSAEMMETVHCGEECVEAALHLGAVLLEHGNSIVQKKFCAILNEKKNSVKAQKFFRLLKERLVKAEAMLGDQRQYDAAVNEANAARNRGGGGKSDGEELKELAFDPRHRLDLVRCARYQHQLFIVHRICRTRYSIFSRC